LYESDLSNAQIICIQKENACGKKGKRKVEQEYQYEQMSLNDLFKV